MCNKCDVKAAKNKEITKQAEDLGHKVKYIGTGMSDQFECSCGWKSNGYWDGREWAWDEFIKHANEIIASGQARLDM